MEYSQLQSLPTALIPQARQLVAVPVGNGLPDQAYQAPLGTGPAGPPGPAGASVTGAPGPAGSQGVVGNPGPAGVKGDTGGVGAVGPQGLIGLAGAVGPQGAIGPVGPGGTGGTGGGATGAQGPQGIPGTPGVAGSTGATGAAGLAGAAGSTGPAGAAGAASTVPGPSGPAGAVGTAGAAGAVGATGAQGPQGVAGPSGTGTGTGTTGPAGPQGIQGVPGPTGPTGLAGAAGVAGTAGATGTAGVAGATGAASTVPGPTGAVGATGATGATGAAGAAGASSGLPVPAAGNTSQTFVQSDLVLTIRAADGAPIYVPTQKLVGNTTIDLLAAGTALTTATLFPVAQGTSASVSVTGAQLATFQLATMKDYRRIKAEVSTGTVAMDNTNANAVFVFTAPGTLTFSAVTNLVSAGLVFQAVVIAQGGIVTFGAGITTTGTTTLAVGQVANVWAFTTSAGVACVYAVTPAVGGAAAATPAATLTITGCTGMTVGGTMTVSGTFTNGTPTGLTYALDGAAAVAAVNPSIGAGTFTFAFAAPAAGAHSVVVTGTGGNTATSAAYAFTVTAAAGATQPYSAVVSVYRSGAVSTVYAELRNAAGTVLYTPSNPAPGGAPKMGFTQTNVAPTSAAQFIQQPGAPPATDFYQTAYTSGWGYMPSGIFGWVLPADGSPALYAGPLA